MGIAYAGSARRDVGDLLIPILEDASSSMELTAHAGLALGMIFTASGDADAAQTIMQTMLDRDEAAMNSPYARFLMLGLGWLGS